MQIRGTSKGCAQRVYISRQSDGRKRVGKKLFDHFLILTFLSLSLSFLPYWCEYSIKEKKKESNEIEFKVEKCAPEDL